MENLTLLQVLDWLARWVFFASILSIFLPPVEFFEEFPSFQKWYRLFCKFLKYFGSLDIRGKVISVYPSYQKTLAGQIKSPFAEKKD